jgi:hypothetical protein
VRSGHETNRGTRGGRPTAYTTQHLSRAHRVLQIKHEYERCNSEQQEPKQKTYAQNPLRQAVFVQENGQAFALGRRRMHSQHIEKQITEIEHHQPMDGIADAQVVRTQTYAQNSMAQELTLVRTCRLKQGNKRKESEREGTKVSEQKGGEKHTLHSIDI